MAKEPIGRPGGEDGGLGDFLTATRSFVDKVTEAFVEAMGDDGDAPLVASSSGVVSAQLTTICNEIANAYTNAGVGAKREVDEIVRLQQGTVLARHGAATAVTALKGKLSGGFWSWISQHLAELKKLLRFIWEKLLHWNVDLFDKLETFIDEIWELIVGLVGGAVGFRRAEIAAELSQRHVNTKNELAALERLSAATAARMGKDTEED